MKKLFVTSLSEEQILELEQLYQKMEVPRVRTRAQMVLAFIEYYNHTMAKPFKWTYQGRALTA